MLKPDKRTRGRMHKQTHVWEGVYNLSTTTYAFHGLSLQSEAIALVLVSNDNMYIDIKPYFCLAYRSILKYRGIRCFPGRDLPNSSVRFSISRNVNKYGVSALAVSES